MASHPVQIGFELFPSHSAVIKRTQEVFGRYRWRDEIPPSSPDFPFLLGLLQNHVEARQKIGAGIAAFFIDKAPEHPTRCFYVRRIDGGETDFGVSSCLKKAFILNKMSLRALVTEDVDRFRAERLLGLTSHFISDYSGLSFSLAEADVDHTPPFEFLIDSFFFGRAENVREEMLTFSSDNRSRPQWKDAEMAEAFKEFHMKNAVLRLVHRRENLSEIKVGNNRWLKAKRTSDRVE